ncbi:MAG: hypothetical protein AB1422_08885 [bacterium]
MNDERTGTILFVDLAAFSMNWDPVQLSIARSFFEKLKTLLVYLWGVPPDRSDDSRYCLLPTGDGAVVVLWKKADAHPQREHTALWLAGSMMVWANTHDPKIGIRCGINQGELDLVKDPYDQTNVCGAAINVAQRIMDAAEPGQLLVRHKEFTQRLDPDDQSKHNDFKYQIEPEEYEVIAKHNEIITVKNVTGRIIRDGREYPFGKSGAPANKWHLQIEPPILSVDKYGWKDKKIPPEELLNKHNKLAFVGATNDQLANIIVKVLRNNPSKNWERIDIFFLKDNILQWMETKERGHEKLLRDKQTAIKNLRKVLNGHVRSLDFREYDRPFYFASYWDWDEPGGRIHISPYIWDADIRVCPAFDYTWVTQQPTPQYQAYREGLKHLQNLSTPIGSL